jgi:2-keto-3-deoxy-L-rhamnonate aldolase RhmA
MSVADSSANVAHKTTSLASEMAKQVAISAAIAAGGGSAAVALAIKTAEVAHYNRLAASALANGVDSAPFVQAAKWVGTHA